MAELELTGVVAGYGGLDVLHGVDLVVPSGTTVAVLGESGSGKSTLLRCVAGLVPVRAGRVRVDGRDVTDVPTHRRDVGMVFQHLALFPHATVAANVAFGLRSRGARAVDDEVAGWLGRVELDGLADRDVASLSGGQRQRVALVRALAARPAVLLLDEPLGAVDAGLRRELLALLRDLFDAEGTTAVHVTHDPAEAAAIADLVAVLDHGRILQVDEPARLWSAPASATAARLAGHPNVLDPVVLGGVVAADPIEVVVVPPEAVALGRPEDDHALPGTVVSLAAGAAWHATVRLDAGAELVVRVDPASAPTTGDRVGARIDPSRVLRLPR